MEIKGENGGTLANATKKGKKKAPPRAHTASRLMQWPCQMQLISSHAPCFDGANLLIAADCTAFAYADFHSRFMKNHITLIGCPRLDAGDYTEKLSEIIKNNDIKSIKVVRMDAPCCAQTESAVINAIRESQKDIPLTVALISTDGKVIG